MWHFEKTVLVREISAKQSAKQDSQPSGLLKASNNSYMATELDMNLIT